MGRVLCMLILTYACLFGCTKLASGLNCYSCNYIGTFSSESSVQGLFDSYAENEPKCSIGEDATKLQPVTCPPVSNGMVAMCSKFDGRGIASYLSVNFSSSYYHRGCVQVAAGDAQTCVTSTDREKSGLNRLLGGDSRLSVYDFAGQYCLCASDLCNGQGKIGQVGVEKLGWTAGVVIGILVLRVYSILP